MIYDTSKLAEQLEHEAGFDAARARAMARILAENVGGSLATREDLLFTKGQLEAAMQFMRADLDTKIGRLDAKIGGPDGKVGGLDGRVGGLDRNIEGMLRDLRVMCWMSGATLAGVIALLGITIWALQVVDMG